ncbi:ATP-binding protein [Haloferula sp.]|uniref:ATP-binding protein n=1 Tax=Haloferula sp. TaxID=2497595 RepID=UPI0032A0736B
MSEVDRKELRHELEDSVAEFKVTVLLGPRLSGKTSLTRVLEIPEENAFDLDDPLDQARLEKPEELLSELRGLVLIDGFQRQPELLPVLLEMASGWVGPSRFLVVGSRSTEAIKEVAAASADKVTVIEMGGLSCRDLGGDAEDQRWLRGGIPGSYFAETDAASLRVRAGAVQAFLRRDLPGMGINVPAERLRQFMIGAARHHGETWNSSAIAASLGISHPTARAYLDLLTETFVLRQLRPFTSKGKKRMVKAPKVYVRDSGLLHELLEIESMEDLQSSDHRDASWEGFALEQLVSVLELKSDELFFWATHGGAEIDLVVERGGKRYGFEFKGTDKPGVTHSMTIAKADLELDQVYLVHPGEESFALREGMEALGLVGLAEFELP